jgi:zinc protease
MIKYKKLMVSLVLFLGFSVQAQVEKMDWNGLEVIWLKDSSPLYTVSVYFADGALSDGEAKGSASAMFSLLTSGTRRYSRKDILDNLEYFGASFSPNVTHEYSVYSVSGLAKDSLPTMKQICHLFQDSIFPVEELETEKNRATDQINNLVRSPDALASTIFREISLRDTPYSYPVGGKLKDVKKLNSNDLAKRLQHFNQKVYKRIYLAGPQDLMALKDVFSKDCGWTKEANFKNQQGEMKLIQKKKTVLIKVPNSNQAQLRIGRILSKEESSDQLPLDLLSGFLGGGFTSELMREVRTKRGLTYTISAFAAGQRDYGRLGITTFSKNETIGETAKVIKETIDNVKVGKFEVENFARAKSNLTGGFPFRLESSSSLLAELIGHDHQGRDYDSIFNYAKLMEKVTQEEVVKNASTLFNWETMTTLILGDASLEKSLRKQFKDIEVKSYKDFL